MSSPIKPMAHYVVAVKEKKPEKTVKDVADGARVVYKNYAATTIKLDKEEYLIIKDEDILATIE